MDQSTITCQEVIDADTKLSPNDDDGESKTNFNEKGAVCKIQNFYILLVFLLVTTALLIAARIYFYLVKYQEKQKLLLPFDNKKLKQV